MSGQDRIGDANQLALALTTRLFDHVSGAQYLSATIGQIRYFSIPRVGLPDDSLQPGQTVRHDSEGESLCSCRARRW